MQRSWLLVGAVVLLALAAGCTGGGGGDGGSSGADWCQTGSVEGIASQQAAGEFTAEVEGTTERDGREVCRISYEFDGGSSQYASMDVFFDEDQEHVELVYYDADGNELGSVDYSNGGTTGGVATDGAGGDGSGSDGAGDGTGQSSWCRVGQSTSVSDAEAGSQMTFTVEERFERDGMTLCRASFETTDGSSGYSRVEMIFNEDESFQELVYYDAEGNVIREVTVSGGS